MAPNFAKLMELLRKSGTRLVAWIGMLRQIAEAAE